jgi:hypothetical protein
MLNDQQSMRGLFKSIFSPINKNSSTMNKDGSKAPRTVRWLLTSILLLLTLLSAIGYYFIVYKEKNISFGKIFPLKPESVQLIPDELHGQHKGMTALTYSHCGDSKRARVRLRADAGFFGGKLLGFLEANRWGCVIVAQPYPTIRRRALSARFGKLGGRLGGRRVFPSGARLAQGAAFCGGAPTRAGRSAGGGAVATLDAPAFRLPGAGGQSETLRPGECGASTQGGRGWRKRSANGSTICP